MAELAEIGFDTFEEKEETLLAYVEKEAFHMDAFKEVTSRYAAVFDFTFELNEVEKVNWNKKWEENYNPIVVDDRCVVRATFHENLGVYPIDIIINPQMSFGTGHHATTWQMLKLQMDIDHAGKSVLDVGTGTGVLAIMARKLGADRVEATDIDDWCIENSRENFERNGITDISTQCGDILNLEFEERFDILLANINKNVLLGQIEVYSGLLKKGGNLLLSGFYESDVKDILACAKNQNLELLMSSSKDNWVALVLVLA